MNFTFNEVEYTYYPNNHILEASYPDNVKCVYLYYVKYIFGTITPEMEELKLDFYRTKYLHLGKGTEPSYEHFFSLSNSPDIIWPIRITLTIDLSLIEDLKENRLIYEMLE